MKLPGKKTLIVVGGVVLLQAAGFFVAMKLFSSGPTPTYGAEGAGDGHGAPADAHGAKADAHGAKHDAHGAKSDGHGAKPDTHAAKHDAHGAKSDAHGAKSDAHGAKSDGHGAKPDAHGAPTTGGGHGGHYAAGGDPKDSAATAEVMLLQKFRVPNNRTGRAILYDFDIAVVVRADRKAEMEALVKERAGEISDQVAQIVRGAEARVLQEFDFRTLRNQIQHALAGIVRDDKLVLRVLIPRCVPLPTG